MTRADVKITPMAVSIDNMSNIELMDNSFNIDNDGEVQIESRFCVTLTLEDFVNMKTLMDIVLGNEAAANKCWLRWIMFDKVFQSESFSNSTLPKRSSDVLKVKSTSSRLTFSLLEKFPIKMCLCNQNNILACADISFDDIGSFPYTSTAWFDLLPIDPSILDVSSTATSVSNPSPSYALPSSSSSSPADPIKTTSSVFASIKVTLSIAFADLPSRGVNGRSTNTMDDVTLMDANTEDVVLTGSAGEEEDEEGNAYEGDGFDTDVAVEDKSPENNRQATSKFTQDSDRRHFRMSVDVRSINSMKRSCHAFVQFMYPHLGIKTPVRSHPVWVPAHSDTEIDNASVTYDTILTRAAFKSLAANNHLVVNLKSKGHMGNEDIGFFEVDYSHLFDGEPHSLRCPVTKKSFKTTDDYISHRNAIALLNATGKTKLQCPTHPVEVYVLDAYYDVRQRSGANVQSAADGGRVRIVLVIENLGVVGYEIGVPVKSGYTMHAGGVYDTNDEGDTQQNEQVAAISNYNNSAASTTNRERERARDEEAEERAWSRAKELEDMKAEWESWRRVAEGRWREELRQKEGDLRKALEDENQLVLAARADDLRRAHEEAGRLEVRLRGAIDAVEKQRAQLLIKEDQMNMKLAQKASELQLLERRIREEARGKVDTETRRAEGLERQIETLKEALARAEKRAKEAERDFEVYRVQVRSLSETQLREEVAKLRAQLAETRTEIERERRVASERELEKEHFRAQMHRLAIALKRERERSSVVARQELEQLRLEFLAREERYVLDGDRDELSTIRKELSQLRSNPTMIHGHIDTFLSGQPITSAEKKPDVISRLQQKKNQLLESGLYDENHDPLIAEINKSILLAQQSLK